MTGFVEANRRPLLRTAAIGLGILAFTALVVTASPLWLPAGVPILLGRLGTAVSVLISSGVGVVATAFNYSSHKWQLFWGIVIVLMSAGLETLNYIPGHWLHVLVAAGAALFGAVMGLLFPPPSSWNMWDVRS
jgi:hypothetical protein